jgi:hypothetical protein
MSSAQTKKTYNKGNENDLSDKDHHDDLLATSKILINTGRVQLCLDTAHARSHNIAGNYQSLQRRSVLKSKKNAESFSDGRNRVCDNHRQQSPLEMQLNTTEKQEGDSSERDNGVKKIIHVNCTGNAHAEVNISFQRNIAFFQPFLAAVNPPKPHEKSNDRQNLCAEKEGNISSEMNMQPR